ncbi:MAG: hypothetical protein ABSD72_15535 [Terracidiphilus sp.]|jgi:hypothetical protein
MFAWLKCKMTEKQLQNWERTRKRGEIDFILVRGVLVFGAGVTVLRLCEDVLLLHMSLSAALVSDMLVQCVAGGLLVGWFTWKINEKNYQSNLTRLKSTEFTESK